jgi:hypothetical protein
MKSLKMRESNRTDFWALIQKSGILVLEIEKNLKMIQKMKKVLPLNPKI